MTRAMVLFLLHAVPAFGQGACPVEADLDRGIRVEYDDGTTEVFRAMEAPGVVAVRGVLGDGTGYRAELGRGVHLLSYAPSAADGAPDVAGRITYDYGLAAMALPVPRPGERFDTPVIVTDAYGSRDEAQSQAYGPEEVLAIGGCSYGMVPVIIAYDTDSAYTEALRYLPELGISLLNWQENAAQPRRTIEPVTIRGGK